MIGCCAVMISAMGSAVSAQRQIIGNIKRIDPAFDQLVAPDAEIEVLASGFQWSEGPVWVPRTQSLLFSDVPRNQIVSWNAREGISIFLEPSGYTGPERPDGREPGSNGLVLDGKGRLVMCCHGDRLIRRLDADGDAETLAASYRGKRFNSPNDLVFDSEGNLYFTDPPYGLTGGLDGPRAELDWCGVYRLSSDGTVTLLTKEMTRPNGIGLSPDETTLYVAQSDSEAALWRAFPLLEDGTLGEGTVFFDATKWVKKRPGLPDGLTIDQRGNVWATGPGGVLVFSPAGKLLGRISTGVPAANCTFGGDGSTLFITADMYLCRVSTKSKGLNLVAAESK